MRQILCDVIESRSWLCLTRYAKSVEETVLSFGK